MAKDLPKQLQTFAWGSGYVFEALEKDGQSFSDTSQIQTLDIEQLRNVDDNHADVLRITSENGEAFTLGNDGGIIFLIAPTSRGVNSLQSRFRITWVVTLSGYVPGGDSVCGDEPVYEPSK